MSTLYFVHVQVWFSHGFASILSLVKKVLAFQKLWQIFNLSLVRNRLPLVLVLVDFSVSCYFLKNLEVVFLSETDMLLHALIGLQ